MEEPSAAKVNRIEKKSAVLAAVISAFLGPGTGQLYNRQWKKGILLIVLALLLVVAVFGCLLMAARAELQALAQTSPETLEAGGFEFALARTILEKNTSTISVFKWSFLILWCYSIVDAYIARKRQLNAGKKA